MSFSIGFFLTNSLSLFHRLCGKIHQMLYSYGFILKPLIGFSDGKFPAQWKFSVFQNIFQNFLGYFIHCELRLHACNLLRCLQIVWRKLSQFCQWNHLSRLELHLSSRDSMSNWWIRNRMGTVSIYFSTKNAIKSFNKPSNT